MHQHQHYLHTNTIDTSTPTPTLQSTPEPTPTTPTATPRERKRETYRSPRDITVRTVDGRLAIVLGGGVRTGGVAYPVLVLRGAVFCHVGADLTTTDGFIPKRNKKQTRKKNSARARTSYSYSYNRSTKSH